MSSGQRRQWSNTNDNAPLMTQGMVKVNGLREIRFQGKSPCHAKR